jgi:hypothetical protein
VVQALGVLLLLGAAAFVVWAVPAITTSKQEQAAEDRRKELASRAAERRRLIEEQRPRRGRLEDGAVVPQVEQAIVADARQRVESGELKTPVRRTDCERLDGNARRTLLSCTAITSDIAATEESRGVLTGYPYRARVERADGRFAFCKTSGRAAEGSLTSTQHLDVPLPRACGGGT